MSRVGLTITVLIKESDAPGRVKVLQLHFSLCPHDYYQSGTCTQNYIIINALNLLWTREIGDQKISCAERFMIVNKHLNQVYEAEPEEFKESIHNAIDEERKAREAEN